MSVDLAICSRLQMLRNGLHRSPRISEEARPALVNMVDDLADVLGVTLRHTPDREKYMQLFEVDGQDGEPRRLN